jgi:hypothetical protein
MSLISAASAEQSSGLSEISSAVRQLDEITQRNAQMVERAVQQAEPAGAPGGASWRKRRVQLPLAARHCRRGHEPGTEGRRQAGAVGQGRVCPGADRSGQWFHDRDMYVFALDRNGVYRAFGGKPEKVGSRVQDIPGVDGEALLQSIIPRPKINRAGSSTTSSTRLTGKVQTKMSYVTQVDDLYVGCGIYKSAVLATA